jgi:Na+/proline symporter
MNSVATLVNKDFALRIKPSMTDRQQLVLMKVASAVAGIIGTAVAAIMATLSITSMFETWNTIIALLGGGFIGMYLLGIFTRRANAIGAITGALASVITTISVERFTDLHYLFLSPLAVTSCVVVGYLVSAMTPTYDDNHLKSLTVWNK